MPLPDLERDLFFSVLFFLVCVWAKTAARAYWGCILHRNCFVVRNSILAFDSSEKKSSQEKDLKTEGDYRGM